MRPAVWWHRCPDSAKQSAVNAAHGGRPPYPVPVRHAAGILLAVVACSSPPAEKRLRDASLRQIGDEGLLRSEAVALSSFRGRVMVLDLWATYCAPCRTVLPAVEEEVERLGGDVALVSVCTDGYTKAAEARALVRELSPRTVLLADDGSYTDAIGVSEIPHLIVVDRAGHIVGEHTFSGADELRAFLTATVTAAQSR
jgi:thiol-disulfide isomerase/thioredoxin